MDFEAMHIWKAFFFELMQILCFILSICKQWQGQALFCWNLSYAEKYLDHSKHKMKNRMKNVSWILHTLNNNLYLNIYRNWVINRVLKYLHQECIQSRLFSIHDFSDQKSCLILLVCIGFEYCIYISWCLLKHHVNEKSIII